MGCPLLRLALLVLLAPRGRAWDSGDLELFDLVEEVPRNFYDFLGVQQVSAAPRPAALLERDPGAPRGSNAAGSPPPPPAPDSRAASGAVTARRCPAPSPPAAPAVPAPPVAPPPLVPAGRPALGLPAPRTLRTAVPRFSPLCTAAASLTLRIVTGCSSRFSSRVPAEGCGPFPWWRLVPPVSFHAQAVSTGTPVPAFLSRVSQFCCPLTSPSRVLCLGPHLMPSLIFWALLSVCISLDLTAVTCPPVSMYLLKS